MFKREVKACNAHDARAARAALLAYLEREATEKAAPPGVVETIFTELIANVCKHGGGKARACVWWTDDGTATLVVGDQGPGFDMSLWQPPSELSEHGRGLMIASALSEDFAVLPGADGRGSRIEAVLPARRRRYAA